MSTPLFNTDPELGRPARRAPNCTMTEGQWLSAMQMFLSGMSDAAVARRFNLSPSTVSAQRFKRGVYRDLRPEPPRLPGLEAPEATPFPERPVLRVAQVPPLKAAGGDGWRTWPFLGGRGASKTLAGAAWPQFAAAWADEVLPSDANNTRRASGLCERARSRSVACVTRLPKERVAPVCVVEQRW